MFISTIQLFLTNKVLLLKCESQPFFSNLTLHVFTLRISAQTNLVNYHYSDLTSNNKLTSYLSLS